MFIEGSISDVGDIEQGRGVELTLSNTQKIWLTGLSEKQTREIARMLYHRVVIRIESRDEQARLRDEDPAPPPFSNIDEATGIKKTGEI